MSKESFGFTSKFKIYYLIFIIRASQSPTRHFGIYDIFLSRRKENLFAITLPIDH